HRVPSQQFCVGGLAGKPERGYTPEEDIVFSRQRSDRDECILLRRPSQLVLLSSTPPRVVAAGPCPRPAPLAELGQEMAQTLRRRSGHQPIAARGLPRPFTS